ncbi:MAG: hypothetical protein ACFCU9_08280 [Cyanophyceae cyanobacterium]
MMTLREQLIEDLKRIPEEDLERVRDLLQSLHTLPDGVRPDIWAAYQASKIERVEVYQSLADS